MGNKSRKLNPNPESKILMNKPVTLGLAPSFGFGDRIGLATAGHVAAMKEAGQGVEPIYPQQSIREMTRTNRTAEQVMSEALTEMEKAGWTGKTGADADHLKSPADVDVTANAGFTFFTIDPSDGVDAEADDYDASVLREKFDGIKDSIEWFSKYNGTTVELPNGTKVELNEEACMRCAVKYGSAINHANELADYIAKVQTDAGRDYEIELSVDETEQPTTLAEHYIIAHQCVERGMKLVSLAPRFIGDFEKGVDFKGDLAALEVSLHDHAAVAELVGPYKLSLHSGSDKLSMYSLLAKATKGMWHVKTAGTSYLEALRVVARHDEALFRRICDFGRERYDTDKKTYHVEAVTSDGPLSKDVSDIVELEKIYLEMWADVPEGKGFTSLPRQILHCTFGSTLTDPELGPAVRSCLESHVDTVSYTHLTLPTKA